MTDKDKGVWKLTQQMLDELHEFAILNAVLDKRLSARGLLKRDIETIKKVQDKYFAYLRETTSEEEK